MKHSGHLTEEQLILHHYGEAGAVEAAEHVASCERCAADYARLCGVLELVDAAPVPDRGGDYGRQVWQRISPRLPSRGILDGWAWFTAPRLALAGSMAALVVVAFLAGQYWRPGGGGSSVSPEGRTRILMVAVGDHLQQSRRLLVELVNTEAGGAVDLSGEQKRAERLAFQNRLYRQTAAQSGEQELADLLDELERLLLEIANRPPEMAATDLIDLQRRIERRGILFRVRVLGERSREQAVPQTIPTKSESHRRSNDV